jgi:hypothetical protein
VVGLERVAAGMEDVVVVAAAAGRGRVARLGGIAVVRGILEVDDVGPGAGNEEGLGIDEVAYAELKEITFFILVRKEEKTYEVQSSFSYQ